MRDGFDCETPASLSAFVERKGATEWSVQLINPTRSEPLLKMTEGLFESLNVGFSQTEVENVGDDLVLVIRDGRVVASSPLKNLEDTLLMVNSDLYTTGTAPIQEITIPDVVQELSDTVFTLVGYPDSNTEKLLLTLVSRHIEQQALRSRTGTLRSSFQRLSLLDDEQGTREVYEQLGKLSELETHVYGVPDWIPPSEMGLTVHRVQEEIPDTWFVVHRADAATDRAMLAVRSEANTWKGYWTRDSAEIRAIDDYVSQTF